ncbi:hypothetical protein BJ912DRAFT_925062 [Pholiota molesta]|nr:hypothetical protein BJ912DRAFT_925062 [Pholiota molesta]
MAPITNGRYPEPGKHTVYDTTQTIDPDTVPLDGGVLFKLLELSIDPYLRGQMRDPDVPSYLPAFPLGQPIYGLAVAVVLRSEHPDCKVGEHFRGVFPHQQYAVVKITPDAFIRKIENPGNMPWSLFLGVLGMPGQTAFIGWREFSRAKKGDTVFVSTGAGPVGSMVIQLAKMEGCKVIGSAGSDEKVQFMKDIGADVAFNYKTTNTLEVLKKEGPIDIYWDNVGNGTFDAALEAAAVGARFIACGMISAYNNPDGMPIYVQNAPRLREVHQHLRLPLRAARAEMAAGLRRDGPAARCGGEDQAPEGPCVRGLDKVGEAILAVQKGTNRGKTVVHVADS